MAKTSAAVKNRYNAKAYDRITVIVKRGEKERLKAKAQELGKKSLNDYILSCIYADEAQPEIESE